MTLKKDLLKLLEDKELIEELIKKILLDPKARKELAEGLAEELIDAAKQNPKIRKKIFEATTKDPELKKRMIKELLEELL